MARRINWQEPDDTNITLIEIVRSATKYGTYTVVTTIDATDDGAAKSSSNSWVVTYVDTDGSFTDWYKVRFYDGTNSVWTEYSEPITGRREGYICSVDDIKHSINTVGRWTDSEIQEAIDEVESDMYIEMGQPIKSVYSEILSIDGSLENTYYLGEEQIYRVDRLFYGTTTKHEYFQDDGFKVNHKYGMIKLLPVASGGPTLDSDCEVEIQFVPKIYNRIAIYRTAKKLLEDMDIITSGGVSRELEIVNMRLNSAESVLNREIGFALSSDYANINQRYYLNRVLVTQDTDRNKYIASYGWD